MSETGERLTVTRVAVDPIVIDGFEVVVPQAPLGEFAVALSPRVLVAEVVPIPFAALSAGKRLTSVQGLYMGHSLVEATGAAAAAIDIYSGGDATGELLCPVTLVAGESTRDWYPLPGIRAAGGIYVNVTEGEVRGTVYFGQRMSESDV